MESSCFESPVFQIRQFPDGTWSVMARIWTPRKQFYEHPTLINLQRDVAEQELYKLLRNPVTTEEVLKVWTFIGD